MILSKGIRKNACLVKLTHKPRIANRAALKPPWIRRPRRAPAAVSASTVIQIWTKKLLFFCTIWTTAGAQLTLAFWCQCAPNSENMDIMLIQWTSSGPSVKPCGGSHNDLFRFRSYPFLLQFSSIASRGKMGTMEILTRRQIITRSHTRKQESIQRLCHLLFHFKVGRMSFLVGRGEFNIFLSLWGDLADGLNLSLG